MNVQAAFNIVSMSVLFKQFMAKMCMYVHMFTNGSLCHIQYIAYAYTHAT